jgi:hypothetical protein
MERALDRHEMAEERNRAEHYFVRPNIMRAGENCFEADGLAAPGRFAGMDAQREEQSAMPVAIEAA